MLRESFIMGKNNSGVVNSAEVVVIMVRENTSNADRFRIWSTTTNNVSINEFVVQACEFALEHLKDDEQE